MRGGDLYASQRFLDEMRLMAGINHPNVAQIYGVGTIDSDPYNAMEYMQRGGLGQPRGTNLARAAAAEDRGRGAAETVKKLAEAVQQMHAKGILHLDLKPANILLTGVGEPKIGDFGIARRGGRNQELTCPGMPLGT